MFYGFLGPRATDPRGNVPRRKQIWQRVAGPYLKPKAMSIDSPVCRSGPPRVPTHGAQFRYLKTADAIAIQRFLFTILEDQARHPRHRLPVIHQQFIPSTASRHWLPSQIIPHDPAQSLTTPPRPRQNFTPVSQAAHRLPSWEQVSRRCAKPKKRGFGVVGRVFGQRESSNHFSPLSALNSGVGSRRCFRSRKRRIPGIPT